jgi:RNA recognition motif-containing protein
MSKDIYVRHISPEASEEDLRKLFGVCGKVTYVHMVKDAKSGEFVGCAFVKMASEAEAKDAIVTLDGALLGNRTILVSVARPQKPKGPVKGRPAGPSRRQPSR